MFRPLFLLCPILLHLLAANTQHILQRLIECGLQLERSGAATGSQESVSGEVPRVQWEIIRTYTGAE